MPIPRQVFLSFKKEKILQFFIDLIDVQQKTMIWEGVAEGLVNPRTETREDQINSVVGLIFKNYPR